MLKTLIAIMAIFVLGITANAETKSYTINFKVSADKQDGTAASTTINASTIVATATDANYVTGKLTAATKANYNSKYGINVATGSAAGSLGFNLSDIAKKKVSKIDIQAAPYNSSKTYSLNVKLGGANNASATQSFRVTGGLNTYSANISNPIDVENITFSCAKGNRSYIQSITLHYDGGSTPEPEIKVSTPTFTPAAGAVEAGTKVSIATSTTGATIYYTRDGTTPTASSTEYTTPITVNEAMTIKAIAVKEGLENSEVATAEYTIAVPFVLVEDLSNLSENAEYVICASGKAKAMLAQKSSNWSATDVNIQDKMLTFGTEAPQIFSIKKDGTNYKISYKEGSSINYLTNNGGSNGLKSDDTGNPITLTMNNGTVTATFDVTTAGKYIYDNGTENSGNLFSAYTSTKSGVFENLRIFMHKLGPAEPIMSFADAGPIAVDYSVNPKPFTNKMITNSDGQVSYSSSAETVATVNADGFVTVKGAGSTVVTATVAATDNYKEKSISYTLNVNKATATLTFKDVPQILKQGETYDLQFETNLPADLYKDFELEDAYAEGEPRFVTFSFDEATKVWKMKAVDTTPVKDNGTNEGTMIGVKFPGNNNWNASEEAVEIITVIENLIQAQCQWSAETVMAPINNFTAPELQNVPTALKNKILYKSSNEKAINVNENGEIIVRTPGKATITASWSKTFDNTNLKTYEAGEVSTEIVISSLAGLNSPIPVPEISTTGTGDFPLSYSYSDNNGFWYGGYDNTSGGLLTITLTTATEGAQIYYKKTQGPGYDPDESSVNKVKTRAGEDFTLYSAPIECGGSEQGKLEFYAKTADKQSNTETFQFSIVTGIDGVDADNDSDARWFNLQGVEVKNPANGIYIRVANGKTTKVIR